MEYNKLKLIIIGALALACVVALIVDASENKDWAVPILLTLVGYVVGNAQVTNQTGKTSPVVSKQIE